MSRKNKHMELDYYGLYLLDYLRENHPDKADDRTFIEERAERAATTYEAYFREGYSPAGAQELAMASLLEGLHFSKHAMLLDILENEFEGKIPAQELSGKGKEKVETFARKLLPLLEEVFSRYDLTDEFAQSSEHEKLYTELTGAVALYLESHGV